MFCFVLCWNKRTGGGPIFTHRPGPRMPLIRHCMFRSICWKMKIAMLDKPKVRCSMKVNGWCSAFTLPHPFPWNSFIVKISCSYTGVVPGSTANSSWKLRWFPECFTHYKLVQHWKEKGWRKKRRTKRRNKSKIKPKNKTDYFMSFK